MAEMMIRWLDDKEKLMINPHMSDPKLPVRNLFSRIELAKENFLT
jgi:hypothetical protein